MYDEVLERADCQKGIYYYEMGRFRQNWQPCLGGGYMKTSSKHLDLPLFIDLRTKLNEKTQ